MTSREAMWHIHDTLLLLKNARDADFTDKDVDALSTLWSMVNGAEDKCNTCLFFRSAHRKRICKTCAKYETCDTGQSEDSFRILDCTDWKSDWFD